MTNFATKLLKIQSGFRPVDSTLNNVEDLCKIILLARTEQHEFCQLKLKCKRKFT